MKVWFCVLATGARVERVFDSVPMAEEWIRKNKHSKKIHIYAHEYLYK